MNKLTYKKSGVDILGGDRFVCEIKKDVSSTFRKEVLTEIGSFGGLFKLKKYNNPVLVSGTDGVGSKILIAQKLNVHNTIGVDLVAMSVNDVLTQGAEPLFFLDYIACGQLKTFTLKQIVKGIAEGCRQSNCALLGGETAEMPALYKKEEYDLAGFAVGVVPKKKIIDGSKIKKGDVILGLQSSGLHSNGYHLARKVLGNDKRILIPTKIYVKNISALLKICKISGMAHITGGGLEGNIKRIIPKGLKAEIDYSSWKPQSIFQEIQDNGKISLQEMRKVFNMGIGFAVILPKAYVKKAVNLLKNCKEKFFIIGEVI